MKVARILLFALVTAQPVAAQVYKCVENGKTTYSQSPCAPAAKSIALQPAPTPSGQLSPELQRVKESTYGLTPIDEQLKELDRQFQKRRAEQEARRQAWLDNNPNAPEKIRLAVTLQQVEIGMQESAVIAALGYPDDQRRHTFFDGNAAWWYYERGSQRLSVHLTNGIVDSIHE